MSTQSSDSSSLGSSQTDGSPRHKHNDYSCYIHLINKTGCTLELVDSKAKFGHWASTNTPAPAIKADSDTLIELKDPRGPHGSEGWCMYRLHHPQRHNAVAFKLKFADPYWAGDDNFLKASTQYPDWVKVDVLKYQSKGHPFIAYAEVSILQNGLGRSRSNRKSQTYSETTSIERPISSTSSNEPPQYEVSQVTKDTTLGQYSSKTTEKNVSVVEVVSYESDTETKEDVTKSETSVVVVDHDIIDEASEEDQSEIEEQDNAPLDPEDKDKDFIEDDSITTSAIEDPFVDTVHEPSEKLTDLVEQSEEEEESEEISAEPETHIAPSVRDIAAIDITHIDNANNDRTTTQEEHSSHKHQTTIESYFSNSTSTFTSTSATTQTTTTIVSEKSSQTESNVSKHVDLGLSRPQDDTVKNIPTQTSIDNNEEKDGKSRDILAPIENDNDSDNDNKDSEENLEENLGEKEKEDEDEEYIHVTQPSPSSPPAPAPAPAQTAQAPPKSIPTPVEKNQSNWAILESQEFKVGIVALVFLTTYGVTAMRVSGGLLRFVGGRR